jgi:hypothetical protein
MTIIAKIEITKMNGLKECNEKAENCLDQIHSFGKQAGDKV